jgi:hypothetical protein
MSYYFYIHEGIYMTSGDQTQDSWFVEVDWRFPRCSRQLQSLLLGAEVDDIREGFWSRCCQTWLYLAAKALGVGPARRWIYLGAKTLRLGLARHCLALSLQWTVAPLSEDVKPLGLDICGSVDCPSTCSPGTRSPRTRLPGARACPEPGYEVGP